MYSVICISLFYQFLSLFFSAYFLNHHQNVNFTLLACETPKSQERKAEILNQQEVIIAILNQYEFIACAIYEDSLDQDLYKRMKKSVVIRDWDVLEGFVLELRKKEGRSKIFCEIERLAKEWKSEKK